MSRILVIPDIHLKPWIFDKAEDTLKTEQADRIVFLGDLIDDWDKQDNEMLYRETFDRAARFFKDHENALYCIGNHDISYVWRKYETGYSGTCENLCDESMRTLMKTLKDRMAIVHRIENILFSHGGVTKYFVESHHLGYRMEDDEVIAQLNALANLPGKQYSYWNDVSPLWFRPDNDFELWKADKYLQITGHTPVRKAYQEGSLMVCDTFSTYSDGITPVGNEKLIMADGVTKEWKEL